ncbi:hypothetical protein AYO45_00700 [Gammaproteobacteria bacterium SCGC AG-212-F23]|nr:hypothetical protein AYO45_00700 [Gammaproteobacteria bacterium SCGC AG-212-F23]
MSSQNHLLKITRLESLTDGIFAIAMTILVLDLRMPLGTTNENLAVIFSHVILVKLSIYIGSFITLGTLWVAMNFQLGLLDRLTRPYLWTNIFYLMVVCVVPFSASFLAAYPKNPLGINFYALNLICASIGQFLTFQCAHISQLNKASYTSAIRHAVVRRILLAPFFYVAAMLTAHWNMTFAFCLLLTPTLLYLFPGRVDRFEQS